MSIYFEVDTARSIQLIKFILSFYIPSHVTEIEPPKQIGMPRRMVPRDPHLQELRQRGHVENNIDERMRQGANPDASFRDIRPRQGLLVDGKINLNDTLVYHSEN